MITSGDGAGGRKGTIVGGGSIWSSCDKLWGGQTTLLRFCVITACFTRREKKQEPLFLMP
jgi:hypothetical protein